MSNRDCKHGQLARSCNICELEEEVIEKAITIAALEREVEALRNPNNDLNQLRELISDSFDAGYSAYSDFDTSKCRTVKQEQYVEEVMERLVDKALAGGRRYETLDI